MESTEAQRIAPDLPRTFQSVPQEQKQEKEQGQEQEKPSKPSAPLETSSDSSDISSDTSSDEESEDESNLPTREDAISSILASIKADVPKTRNEIVEVYKIPKVTITENMQLYELGTVQSIVENQIVIKATYNDRERVVDAGTVVCSSDRKSIAYIADTFARVDQPMHSMGFNSEEELAASGLKIGDKVFYINDAEFTEFAFTSALRMKKPTDASDIHDEEAASEMEFSDDEEEKEWKRLHGKKKNRNKKGGRDRDDPRGGRHLNDRQASPGAQYSPDHGRGAGGNRFQSQEPKFTQHQGRHDDQPYKRNRRPYHDLDSAGNNSGPQQYSPRNQSRHGPRPPYQSAQSHHQRHQQQQQSQNATSNQGSGYQQQSTHGQFQAQPNLNFGFSQQPAFSSVSQPPSYPTASPSPAYPAFPQPPPFPMFDTSTQASRYQVPAYSQAAAPATFNQPAPPPIFNQAVPAPASTPGIPPINFQMLASFLAGQQQQHQQQQTGGPPQQQQPQQSNTSGITKYPAFPPPPNR